MIEMSVVGLGLDGYQSVVLLTDAARARALPIWIGGFEARAISLAVNHVKAGRPMTHDLLLNTINQLGFDVDHVEIDILDGKTYAAKIKLSAKEPVENPEREIDARPSDAIAVAVAANAPILVSPQLVSQATVAFVENKENEESTKFKEFIQEVKASDFTLPGFDPKDLGDE